MKYAWLLVFLIFASMAMWNLPQPIKTIHLEEKEPFYISIDGAIAIPNTFVFYEPVTIQQIIEYSGGYLDEADIYFRQQSLYDTSMQIFVPFLKEDESEEIIQININDATFAELLNIPYMTETRAAELIVYRSQFGKFNTVDELIKVKYIGQATLENLRPYVTTT